MLLGPPTNNLFLVTSCINTSYGVFSPQQRLDQTIETIKSIRTFAPNSKIFIADNSYQKELNEGVYKYFTKICDFVANLSNEENCRKLNSVKLKSAADTMLTLKMIELLLKHKNGLKLLNQSKFLYRISGRYSLNSNFKENNHHENFGKFILKRHDTWRENKSIDGLYITRLIGFCPSLCVIFHNILAKSVDTIINENVDMEHAIYKNMDKKFVKLVNLLGIQGLVSPNGSFHED
jgi:hypothetical protein